jgi:hypothetical protein
MQSQYNLNDQPLPIRRMILKDRVQQYHNMLTCIHDLSDTEREKLTEWLCQAEEELNALPQESDDEVAIHPEAH